MNRLHIFVITIFLLLGSASLCGTVLIDQNGNGGFENGAAFSDNGWTTVYTPPDQTNRWYLGTAPSDYTGARCAYISNDATNWNYALTASNVFFYMDVAFPTGESDIRLSFDFKGVGQLTTGFLRVYLVSTSTILYPLNPPAISSAIGYQYYNLTPQWTRTGITIPASNAGTSKRLAFCWKNGTTGYNPPAAIDNISLTSQVPAPLSGMYYLDNTHATGGIYFNNFVDAFLALNGSGVSGLTAFNISTGQQWLNLPPPLTVIGSPAANVLFQKEGEEANPILKSYGLGGGATTNYEGVITLAGADYCTFDGLDVQLAGAVETAAGTYLYPLDYGYYIYAASATNGAQHNTIQNCCIVLNKLNLNSRAVNQVYAVTPTSDTGANSYNRFLYISVENSQFGIWIQASSATIADLNNEISHCVIGGAAADDMGGSAQTPKGIFAGYQNGVIISCNEVRNLTGTSYGPTAIDLTYGKGDCRIFNNFIHDIKTTSLTCLGMYIHLSYPGPHNVYVYNNIITGLSSLYTGSASTSYAVTGIDMLGSSGNYYIDFNSIRVDGPLNACSAGIYVENTYNNQSYDGHNFIRNNIIAVFSPGQTGNARHYGIMFEDHATLIGASGSLSDNNVIYLQNPGNGYPIRGSGTQYSTLAAWTTASGFDAHSFSTDPLCISAANLHLTADSDSPARAHGSFFDGTITWVNDDFDGDARNMSTPDIGADEVYTASGLAVPEVAISFVEGMIILGWEEVAGATSYRVESSTYPVGGFSLLGNTLNLFYADVPSVKMFYRVFAIAE